jgi:hypothetical protein
MNILTYLGSDNRIAQWWTHFLAARKGCHLKCGPYAWDLTKGARIIRLGRRQFASVGTLATDFDALFEALLAHDVGHQSMLDFSRLHVHTFRDSGLAFELAEWPEKDAPIDDYFDWFRPTPDDLVFDLGADCGVSTFMLSPLAKNVIAFQPNAGLRELLARNVARHQLTNVAVANEEVNSLAGLIRIYGKPQFCRVNLDQVAASFFAADAEEWIFQSIFLAARSDSRLVRWRFASFLKKAGFETASDHALGMVWARPGPLQHAR